MAKHAKKKAAGRRTASKERAATSKVAAKPATRAVKSKLTTKPVDAAAKAATRRSRTPAKEPASGAAPAVAVATPAAAVPGAEEVLARLRAVDFFEGWPADAVARAEAHVRSGARPEFFAQPEWPGLVIGSIHFDFETYEGPGSYVARLKEFAAASFGLFQPSKMSARKKGEKVVLRVEHRGNAHEHELPWEEDSDWIEDELLDALWEVCDDLPGPPMHFHHIQDGQAGGFVLAGDAAYDRAAAAGLLPPREERRGRPRSPDAGASPAARKVLASLDEERYFEALPPSLAARLRQRVIAAAGADPKRGPLGLVIAEVLDDELRTPEGARRLVAQVQENAPEVCPEGLTFDVRLEGSALAYTFAAGDKTHGGVQVHEPATRDFVIDDLLADLDRLGEDVAGAPRAFRLDHYWRFKAKGKPWRVIVRPAAPGFDDWVACDYEDRTRAKEN